MTDENPKLVSLLEAARAIEAGSERAAFIKAECADDVALQRRVEELLESESQAEHGRTSDSTLENRHAISAHLEQREARRSEPTAAHEPPMPSGSGVAGRSVLNALAQTFSIPRLILRNEETEPLPLQTPNPSSSPHAVAREDGESRYRLEAEIARGGMGAVIKGRDNDLGRDLAIKVLLEEHQDRPEMVQRFIEEAQIGGQLQHPGVAPIYELGQFDDHRPFFSMKLVKGQTLAKLLAERDDPTQDRARFVNIFEQICQTMAYAHARGVIHRDLKPANVMVGAFGEVQVMDWGLAKVLQAGGTAAQHSPASSGSSSVQTIRSGDSDSGSIDTAGSHTMAGSVLGTLAYMSPEQARGEVDRVDERADVFGLGSILCEILTGTPPYTGNNGREILRAASQGELGDCNQRLADCGADGELITLAGDCLSADREQRPRDAGVLSAQVTAYLESVEIKLREVEVKRAAQEARADAEAARVEAERRRAEAESARAQEEIRRRKISLALAGSVLLLIALGSAGWLYVERQKANRQEAEAIAQRKHANEMETLAEERDSQRKSAEAATAAALKSEKRSRQLRYTTDIQLVSTLTKQKSVNATQVLFRLDEHSPDKSPKLTGKQDLRGFEWHYLRRIASGLGSKLLSFDEPILDMTFDANGQLVTIDSDGRIQRWDENANEVGQPIDRQALRDVSRVKFAPDGQRVALAVGDEVWIRGATQRTETPISFATRARGGLLFSADGRILVTVDTDVAWWDAYTGERIAQREFGLDPTFMLPNYSCVTADGLTVVVGGLGDSRSDFMVLKANPQRNDVDIVRLVEAGNGTKRAFAISPDGENTIVSAALGRGVSHFSNATGLRKRGLKGLHQSSSTVISFGDDGKSLVVASSDGTVKYLPDYDSPELSDSISLIGHTDAVINLAVDRNRVASADITGQVRIWDTEQDFVGYRVLAGANGYSADFSPGGTLLAVSEMPRLAPQGSKISLRDGDTGQVVAQLAREDDGLCIWSVAFSPDGRHLAAGIGGRDPHRARIELWDIVRRQRVGEMLVPSLPQAIVERNRGGIFCLAFSPDGRRLVAGLHSMYTNRNLVDDFPLLVFDVATRKLAHQLAGHGNVISTVSYSHDGSRLVSTSQDGSARVWDTSTWRELRVLKEPDAEVPRMIAGRFSRDGSMLALAGSKGVINIYDAKQGSRVQLLRGHASQVKTTAFSPDGLTLASGGDDGTMRLWNVGSWRSMITFKPREAINPQCIRFAPDGKRLLVASGNLDAVLLAVDEGPATAERLAAQLESLLAADDAFQSRVRMLSDNPQMLPALTLLAERRGNEPQVEAAFAAVTAGVGGEDSEDTARAFDHLRKVSSTPPRDWLRTPGLLRLAAALVKQDRVAEAAELLVDGKRRRFEDGVSPEQLGCRLKRKSDSVEVSLVRPNSPAWRAGLQLGDEVTGFNQVTLTEAMFEEFERVNRDQSVARIPISILRGGTSQKLELVKPNASLIDSTNALISEVKHRLEKSPDDAELLKLMGELEDATAPTNTDY